MAVTFNRPPGMKYTDMAIYIDKHLPEIEVPYQHPDVEAKIYEYIYHIVYALACKSGYFKNFNDYDNYACYAASELYFSMRNKLINAGKEIRGRIVVPIKSSLNFIKATMFPLKVNYQRENFATVLNPKIHDDVDYIDAKMRESIQQQYRPVLQESYESAVQRVPQLIKNVVKKTPFRNDKVMCHRLYLSIMLTLINDLTIPNKLKHKIVSKMTDQNQEKSLTKLLNAYKTNDETALLWHIDQDISNYIRLLTTKVKKEFSKELHYYIHGDDLSDEMLDNIMSSAYENYVYTGDSDQ